MILTPTLKPPLGRRKSRSQPDLPSLGIKSSLNISSSPIITNTEKTSAQALNSGSVTQTGRFFLFPCSPKPANINTTTATTTTTVQASSRLQNLDASSTPTLTTRGSKHAKALHEALTVPSLTPSATRSPSVNGPQHHPDRRVSAPALSPLSTRTGPPAVNKTTRRNTVCADSNVVIVKETPTQLYTIHALDEEHQSPTFTSPTRSTTAQDRRNSVTSATNGGLFIPGITWSVENMPQQQRHAHTQAAHVHGTTPARSIKTRTWSGSSCSPSMLPHCEVLHRTEISIANAHAAAASAGMNMQHMHRYSCPTDLCMACTSHPDLQEQFYMSDPMLMSSSSPTTSHDTPSPHLHSHENLHGACGCRMSVVESIERLNMEFSLARKQQEMELQLLNARVKMQDQVIAHLLAEQKKAGLSSDPNGMMDVLVRLDMEVESLRRENQVLRQAMGLNA